MNIVGVLLLIGAILDLEHITIYTTRIPFPVLSHISQLIFNQTNSDFVCLFLTILWREQGHLYHL